MTTLDQISLRIITEQELVIGPIAWEEAKKVQGLHVDAEKKAVELASDSPDVVNKLVAQYSRLFGPASSEVCREAVADLIVELPKDQVPSSLQ